MESKIYIDSVGKSESNVDIKIINKHNQTATTGEVGEILCKTPLMFSGYYDLKEKTKKSMSNGYFRTGDLGKLNEQGYLYFMGRKKDIIITGGINVYPKDIEMVLLKHKDVFEVAVVPFPDENLGEIVAAVIVCKKNTIVKIKELKMLCATQLADFQQPLSYTFVDKLYKNSMGKMVKFKIVDQVKIATSILNS